MKYLKEFINDNPGLKITELEELFNLNKIEILNELFTGIESEYIHFDRKWFIFNETNLLMLRDKNIFGDYSNDKIIDSLNYLLINLFEIIEEVVHHDESCFFPMKTNSWNFSNYEDVKTNIVFYIYSLMISMTYEYLDVSRSNYQINSSVSNILTRSLGQDLNLDYILKAHEAMYYGDYLYPEFLDLLAFYDNENYARVSIITLSYLDAIKEEFIKYFDKNDFPKANLYFGNLFTYLYSLQNNEPYQLGLIRCDNCKRLMIETLLEERGDRFLCDDCLVGKL